MTATTQRPPAFDSRVMAFMPGLQNLSRKYKKTWEDRNDLVTDTIAYALEKWENFREEGGMYNWLAWNMRGIASNQRQRRNLHIVEAPVQYALASSQPTQERYCELSSVLRILPAGRGGSVLLRRAMGEQLNEIGADLGVSPERVRQIEEKARALLVKRSARRMVAA